MSSMRNYPFRIDYAFYLDEDMVKTLMESQDPPVDDVSDMVDIIRNGESVADLRVTSGLDGWIDTMETFSGSDGDYSERPVNDEDQVFYLVPNRGPSMFEQSYQNPEELIREFRDRLGALSFDPDKIENFNAHVVRIEGTVFY